MFTDALTLSEPRVDRSDLGLLFHRLNNQLGIILAHAELLQAKSGDDMNRSRAGHVIGSVLDAFGTAQEIRERMQMSQRMMALD